MFHMLSCFDLKDNVTIKEFQEANALFVAHMKGLGMVESVSPVGRRQHHPIMDTDHERGQEYFFTMTFLDRDQCDQAVDCIQSHCEPEDKIHFAISSKIINYVFICWDDI